MFYSQCLLSRKGPLGAIWLAAYFHKKLKKDQIAQTDISSSVDEIVLNEVTVTYRVLGYLLLGVVRIYSKKVEYLFDDCKDVLIKINTYAVTKKDKLPMEAMCAPYSSITLPDKFELDAFDLEIVEEVSRGTLKTRKPITLKEAWEVARNDYSLDKYHEEEGTTCFASSTAYTPDEDAPLPHTMHIDTRVSPSQSGSEASMEKLQSVQLPQKQCPDLEIFPEADEPLTPGTKFDEMYNHDERIKFMDMTPPGPGEPHVLSEGHPVASTVDRTPDNSKLPYSSGQQGDVTPEFMVIPTPARKEQSRRSRKRKHLFDDVIVLSNDVVRRTLHDSSSLVCKRRKAPETVLDAWRASTFSKLRQDFLKPLILGSSWLGDLFYRKNFKTQEQIEADKGSIKSRVEVFETHCIDSEQRAALEESSVDHLASVGLVKCATSKSDKMGAKISVESVGEELSAETPDLGLNLMDEETGLHEEHQNRDEWSIRTRTVAKNLSKRFQTKKEQNEKEVLNLAPVLEGKTKKESARLFYELLVLKSLDVIDVKQESPYGDILVLATPGIEAVH
ncbi:Rad21/Rec8-like protein [Macleaya cordata]|uniref:Rad21/Rec8-like protein n=1 Tax=Macleaya cordata TaxID=56857 RepID=A0A200QY75_MACCD|nr:Rad21/Rec8-like protein [Macleaya cordata]